MIETEVGREVEKDEIVVTEVLEEIVANTVKAEMNENQKATTHRKYLC